MYLQFEQEQVLQSMIGSHTGSGQKFTLYIEGVYMMCLTGKGWLLCEGQGLLPVHARQGGGHSGI